MLITPYKPIKEDGACDSCGRPICSVAMRIDPPLDETGATIYPEIELGRVYDICYVCLLRSLGVKLNSGDDPGRTSER